MTIYAINKGEDPKVAHDRLTKEAFFPVVEQELFYQNQNRQLNTFIEGRTRIDLSKGENEFIRLPRHYGILDVERHHVISVVTHDNYELIRNETAFGIAKHRVVPKIFPRAEKDSFLCNQVVLSDSRGICYIDLCCHCYTPPRAFKDVWMPFIRILNSYNKTYKLSYVLGFCNRTSQNRVIFADKMVPLSSAHNDVQNKLDKEIQKKFYDISRFEVESYERLIELKKFYFPRKMMLALYCMVFGVKAEAGRHLSLREREKRHDFVEAMDSWTTEFFTVQGENAYAAFCVLAAAASRPVSYFTSENRMNTLQEKVGGWSYNFTERVKEPSFDIDEYLSEGCHGAAKSLRDIYASVQSSRPTFEGFNEAGDGHNTDS